MEIIEQPFSKQQREELEGIVAFSTKLFRLTLYAAFIIFIGGFFYWFQNLFSRSYPFWVLPTATISIWLYFRSGRWTGGSELRKRIIEDLNAGKAVVTVIVPKIVEEVEELEDEGPSYIIETSNKEQYLLTGQFLDKYKSKKFPWSKFGVIEAPRSKYFFGLKRMGEPIQADSKRPPFSYRQAKELGCFSSSFIILDQPKRRLLDKT